MSVRFLIAAFVSVVALHSAPSNADTQAGSKNVLVFGVVPQQAPEKLAQAWNPFLKYLGEKIGRTIKFDSAPDIESFDKRTANGDFDLVYMNPMYYTALHQSVGYQVFAKEKDTMLKGIVVVQKNSPYQKLEDLVGKTIAFPGPISFAATILPLLEFKTYGVNITPLYVGSHESVYNNVARGLHVAGGGVAKTLAQADSLVRDELRILWSSDSYTPHPLASHPRIDQALIKQMAEIMFDLDQNERGKNLLREMRFRGFVSAQNQEYEKLHLLSKKK